MNIFINDFVMHILYNICIKFCWFISIFIYYKYFYQCFDNARSAHCFYSFTYMAQCFYQYRVYHALLLSIMRVSRTTFNNQIIWITHNINSFLSTSRDSTLFISIMTHMSSNLQGGFLLCTIVIMSSVKMLSNKVVLRTHFKLNVCLTLTT